MAFRFRREGQFVKNRVHLDQSGFRPFMDELKWEVLEWHYNFYMAPQILKTLLRHQRACEPLHDLHVGANYRTKRRPFFPLAVPLVRPFRRSSNPFCLVSNNKTGFVYFNENTSLRAPEGSTILSRLRVKKTMYPTPHGKVKIGGTDSRPPVFPKGV